MTDLCFFNPIKKDIVDGAILGKDGVYRGQYGGRTLEETAAEYKCPVELRDTDEAWKAHQDARLTEPVEIDKARFWEMLEILPPCRWVRGDSSESFHMSEHTTGNVTLILVRIGKRYFKYEGYANTTHIERVEKCRPLYNATEEFEK